MKKVLLLIISLINLINLSSCKNIDLYKDIVDKVVEITLESNTNKYYATGTIISNDGLILTNKHVIDNKDEDTQISISFINDNNDYKATIFDVSNDYDLCLLKIDKKTSHFNKISTYISIGDKVYTIGNSNGYGLSYLDGIITSEYKNIIYNDTNILSIQTNIEIYDGSSGGPLYNTKGELLGIMTFRVKDNGMYVPGMSFALPSKCINEYLGRLNL